MSPYFVGEKQLVPTYVNPINSSVGKKGWYKDGGQKIPLLEKNRKEREQAVKSSPDNGWWMRKKRNGTMINSVKNCSHQAHAHVCMQLFREISHRPFSRLPEFFTQIVSSKTRYPNTRIENLFRCGRILCPIFPSLIFFLLCLVVRKTVRRPK